MRLIRYSTRSLFVATAVFAVCMSYYVWCNKQQENAIALIESHGGLVAIGDDWLFLGNKLALPGVRSSKFRIYDFVNKPVNAVKIDCKSYDSDIRDAMHKLPTIESIHLVGDNAPAITNKLQQEFPDVEVIDVQAAWRKIKR
jgi:hypothetical protein